VEETEISETISQCETIVACRGLAHALDCWKDSSLEDFMESCDRRKPLETNPSHPHHAKRTSQLNTSPSRIRREQAMARKIERANGSLKKRRIASARGKILLSLLAISPIGAVAECVSLAGSTQCPAFSAASISTNQTLVDLLYVDSA